MTLKTQNFGEIQIRQEDIINFSEGIPGFWNAKDFVLLFQEQTQEQEGNESIICFLQSVTDEELSFVLIDISSFQPSYRPLALLEYAKTAENFDQKNLAVYNILTVHDNLNDSTANLKAPIIIDITENTGRQVLCADEDFPIRASILELTGQAKDGGCQC